MALKVPKASAKMSLIVRPLKRKIILEVSLPGQPCTKVQRGNVQPQHVKQPSLAEIPEKVSTDNQDISATILQKPPRTSASENSEKASTDKEPKSATEEQQPGKRQKKPECPSDLRHAKVHSQICYADEAGKAADLAKYGKSCQDYIREETFINVKID